MKTVQQLIKSLAVNYHAYLGASANGDSNGIIVWGEMLLEAQELTGVEMFEPENLTSAIELHRRKQQMDRIAA